MKHLIAILTVAITLTTTSAIAKKKPFLVVKELQRIISSTPNKTTIGIALIKNTKDYTIAKLHKIMEKTGAQKIYTIPKNNSQGLNMGIITPLLMKECSARTNAHWNAEKSSVQYKKTKLISEQKKIFFCDRNGIITTEKHLKNEFTLFIFTTSIPNI